MQQITAAIATLVLTTGAFAKLELKDVQASYGQLGPERESTEYVPGDEVYFRFNVVGAQSDSDGRINMEMKLVVIDSDGKKIYDETFPHRQPLVLGGNAFPASARILLGLQTAPGEYTFAVTLRDNVSEQSASFERKVKCKPLEFALVAIRFYQDAQGRVPATVGGTVSQSLFLRMYAVGFDRGKGQIDLAMKIETLDADGKPLMRKPIQAAFHNEDPAVVPQLGRIDLTGEMTLNRAGDYKLRITVTDTIAKKTATFEAPLKVRTP